MSATVPPMARSYWRRQRVSCCEGRAGGDLADSVALSADAERAVGVEAGPGEGDEFAAAESEEAEANGELVAGADPGTSWQAGIRARKASS